MSSSTNSGFPSLTKWQLALILGTPVAAGLGYYCYKNMCKDEIPDHPPDFDKKKTKPSLNEVSKPKTPLEKAIELKTLGNEAYKKHDYEKALDFYSQAIEVCPKDETETIPLLHQNRAAVYSILKDHDSVIKECSAALEINPKYRKALMRRATSYQIKEDLQAALEDITAVCILDGFSDQTALYTADSILKEYGKRNAAEIFKTRKPLPPSKHFIKTYLSAFSCDPILGNVEERLKGSVGDGQHISLNKALQLFQDEKYDKIVGACEEVIASPEVDDHTKKLAELLTATMNIFCDQRSKAVEQLTAIIDAKDVDPKITVNALIKRAAMHFQMENFQKCLDDFDTAVKIDEENADIYHHRGQIHVLMNDMKKAKLDFTMAQSKNPDSPIIAVQKCYTDFRYASINEGEKRAEACMKNFKSLIDKYPKCVECYFLYAQVLMAKHEYTEADKLFKDAMKVDPTNATLYVHRGLLMFQWTGVADKGIPLIQKAIEIDDRCELAYETLGTLKVQNGNLEEAIELFEKALNIAKTEVEVVHILSLKYAAEAQLKIATKFNFYKDRKIVNS